MLCKFYLNETFLKKLKRKTMMEVTEKRSERWGKREMGRKNVPSWQRWA